MKYIDVLAVPTWPSSSSSRSRSRNLELHGRSQLCDRVSEHCHNSINGKPGSFSRRAGDCDRGGRGGRGGRCSWAGDLPGGCVLGRGGGAYVDGRFARSECSTARVCPFCPLPCGGNVGSCKGAW